MRVMPGERAGAEGERAMVRAALIVGVGDGISASFARLLAQDGYKVGLAARRPDKLEALRAEIDGLVFGCDVTEADQVARLFAQADDQLGALGVVHYNPSYRTRGPLVGLDPEEVRKSLMVSAYGGFLVAQQAARRMLRDGSGAILFTGASASVKGYAGSAPFAMGKFALRGLAQSLARELAPKNIHVAHFVIDGGVRSAQRPVPADRPDSLLDPDAIAQSYLAILKQPRSAWSWEVELRPWVETF
jgi:NAD(P)-dependent dehydrogenase (short-subunit alcohol dehydrogenase family)